MVASSNTSSRWWRRLLGSRPHPESESESATVSTRLSCLSANEIIHFAVDASATAEPHPGACSWPEQMRAGEQLIAARLCRLELRCIAANRRRNTGWLMRLAHVSSAHWHRRLALRGGLDPQPHPCGDRTDEDHQLCGSEHDPLQHQTPAEPLPGLGESGQDAPSTSPASTPTTTPPISRPRIVPCASLADAAADRGGVDPDVGDSPRYAGTRAALQSGQVKKLRSGTVWPFSQIQERSIAMIEVKTSSPRKEASEGLSS